MPDIRRALKKFLPHLLRARDDGLNEADTVQRLVLFFHEVLGYDQFEEITREAQIRDKFVDLAIKLDGKIRLLVEAKSAATTLRDRHLEQAERYAAEGNYPWALLTNGLTWKLYHLTFDEGIEYVKVFEIELGSDEAGDDSCERLALLHRSSLLKGELEEFWAHRQALDAESIGKALFTENTLRLIRRNIRRREGLLIDVEDLATAIRDMFSVETREKIGAVRIQRQRRVRKKADAAQGPPAAPSATSEPTQAGIPVSPVAPPPG